MSYRCDICGAKQPPKQTRLLYQVIRHGQIRRELAVCSVCLALLKAQGLTSVKDPYYLRPKHGETTVAVAPEPQPVQPPPRPEQVGAIAKTISL